MCEGSTEARKQRHAAKPLYQRLGGRPAIRAVVAEVVAMKEADELTKPTMAGVDREKMIENITDYLSAGTGGPETYKGRDVAEAHARMHLTDAHFVAVGHMVVTVMQRFKVPEPETQEVVCALVGQHDLVVQPVTARR
jgi:hemoglobin